MFVRARFFRHRIFEAFHLHSHRLPDEIAPEFKILIKQLFHQLYVQIHPYYYSLDDDQWDFFYLNYASVLRPLLDRLEALQATSTERENQIAQFHGEMPSNQNPIAQPVFSLTYQLITLLQPLLESTNACHRDQLTLLCQEDAPERVRRMLQHLLEWEDRRQRAHTIRGQITIWNLAEEMSAAAQYTR